MWTLEGVQAEVDYRREGTRDRTSKLHLHEVRRAAPSRWLRVLRRHGETRAA